MAMSPISNIDRVVLLLRQRLEERERTLRKSTAGARSSGDRAQATQADRIRALAALDSIDERGLRRAFIQTLLADQFGQRLLNDAQFQQVVERVTNAIEADPATTRLLSRLVSDLRARGDLPRGGSAA